MRRTTLVLTLLALLLPVLAAAAEVTFQFTAPGAGRVEVAGTFNGWSPTLMQKGEGDLWTFTLDLAPGEYQYKFVIDGAWREDPAAESYVDDGYGGRNGVFTMGDAAKTLGAAGAAAGAVSKAPAAAAGATVPVTFTFEPKTGGVRDVFLAGSFNDWSPDRDAMRDEDGDGVYTITLQLPRGRSLYKFVVDGTWLADENAAESEDDGYGGQNSIIHAGGGAATGMFRVPFRYKATGRPGQVFLAGSFNDWSPDRDAMSDADGDGVWELTLVLPAGEVVYKFVADGNWITDHEGADTFVDDGYGGQNSVLDVDERFEAVARERGDGKIETGALRFTPAFPDLNRLSPEAIEVTFRTAAGDAERVFLVTAPAGGGPAASRGLSLVASDQVSDIWRVAVSVAALDWRGGLRFRVEDGEALLAVGADGTAIVRSAGAVMDLAPFRVDPDALPAFYTPDWVKDGIFYQIFPERFRNGDPDNDPDFSEWYYAGANTLPPSGKTNGEYFHLVEDWYDYGGLTRSPYRTDGRPDYFSFYGGDIPGVEQELDYLADLGVSIIYFNPITQGKSNHKYDATDYMTVDPHFASQAGFLRFVKAAHAKGIRVVVEAVFNHCGDTHWAFVDTKKNGRRSEYWDWFEWKKWPLPESGDYKAADYYECWWGFGLHPNLNFDLSRTDSQESAVKDSAEAEVNWPLVNHLLEVTRFWLEDMDVDGFRMDVPNDCPFWFWKLFNERVKSIKPDAYLVGELWSYAPEWVGPEMFDAVMNYKYFKEPVTRWIGQGQGNAAKFERDMAPGRTAYPSQAVQVMMNLIDSHDTVRFVTTAAGDRRRLLMAYALAMTYPGAPHIWYGDEIGMEGQKDPDCRRPFYWNYAEDPDRVALRESVKKLCRLRREHAALQRGGFRVVAAAGQDYAYLREGDGERLLTVIHNSDQAGAVVLDLGALGVADGSRWRFLYGGSDPTGRTRLAVEGGALTVGLGSLAAAVLLEER
ncbi:MAG: hypothetical protein JW819_00435 [Candidatus Krumholzibacteriota bacterium]|nr:hypothetical protein [Candidatus Krumholzibacteriota bacterium]